MSWTLEKVDSQKFYPLHAPGMPAPGPSFLMYAEQCGDQKLDKKELTAARSGKRRDPYGDKLTEVYRRCLYSRGEMMMPMQVKQGRRKQLSVVSGHIWGDPDGHGPRRADVMIIGKMLGEEERNYGTNFVGPTGKMLKELLLKYDIPFDDFYVTNVLKTEHPDNGNGFSLKWVEDWKPLLQQELRLVRPKYILCLGADACQALLGKEANLKFMEGRIVEHRIPIDKKYKPVDEAKYHTALVMGCTHPAAVLRMPEMGDKLDDAVARFGQMIRGVRWDKGEDDLDHRVIDDIQSLRDLEREIKKDCDHNMIAVDAEWHGEHPENAGSYLRTIQISWKHKTAACISLRHPGGGKRFKGKFKEAAEILTRILKGRMIVGQFLAADAEWLIPFGVNLRKMYRVPKTWQEFQETAHAGGECGFDTGLAWHAANETGDFGLTAMTLRFTSAPRYDVLLDKWKKDYCLANKMKESSLEGYGMCPPEILEPYGNYDADVTRRIAIKLLSILDSDRFGNNCWESYWRNMRAYQAVFEINTTGILVDRNRLDRLAELYLSTQENILATIREWSRWEELNVASVNQIREWLFGERFNGAKREDPNVPRRLRPKGAKSLGLRPVMSNDKRPVMWDDVVERGQENEKLPSTKGQALSILQQQADGYELRKKKSGKRYVAEVNYAEQVGWLRDFRYIGQVLKTTLRPPKLDENDNFAEDDDGFYLYEKEKGLPASICDDGLIRTHIYPTLETCRWASSRPNLTNISKRREKDYKRILGDKYKWPLRTIFKAPPGYVLMEADFVGAELFGAAVMAGDEAMIEHCRRNQLPETHPNYYDIHSQVAVRAFRLKCAPTKAGLETLGRSNLRIVAKSVIFGLMYGRGAKAISIAAQEEKIPLTKQEAQKIIDTIFEMYPKLQPFFAECGVRAIEHGWMCNCWGQYRRFPPVLEEKQIGDFERQAQNFPMQSLVAGAMSQAMDNLMEMRDEHELGDALFRIALQIHDAGLFLVPYAHVPIVADYFIPEAMCKRVPIYQTALDGMPMSDEPYYMGVDINIYEYWGEQLMPDRCKELGIHPKYAGFHKAPDGKGWCHREIKAGQKWLKGKWVPLAA